MSDIFLDKATSQRELWGTVRITKDGVTKQGVKVNLYRKDRAGESYVDTAVTCSDGIYSFSELADGLYKIVPECSVCTFSPAFHDNVQIPSTATFDFKSVCTPGECQ
jgi:5-hydroxyisourate hydrolase-like protein (transthyretin family)